MNQRHSRAATLAGTALTVFSCMLPVIPGDSRAASGSARAEAMEVLHDARIMRVKGSRHTSGGGLLNYHGGPTGVQTYPVTVVLVYWGSQWLNNDPSGQAAIQQSFFGAVGGSSWNNSVTQYCEGVATGTTTCGSSGTPAGNQPLTVIVKWDNSSAAPSKPTQSQIAAEAVKYASVAGTTNVQYVINTATGNNSSGFGTQYCAYHSSTSTTVGTLSYTYMPYITDAGASCGANFNNLGPKAGITIVGGHEFGESETDPVPSSGWLDGSGAENGDKCAWISSGQGAAADVSLNGSTSFPVQSLWSNAFNGGAGGCVLSY